MNTIELIQRAVSEENAKYAGKVADICRLKGGMNYDETYAFVNEIQPIDKRDWEALLLESEEHS